MDRKQSLAQLNRITRNNFAHSSEILSIASTLSELASKTSETDAATAKRLIDLSRRLIRIGEDMSTEASDAQAYVSKSL